MTAEEYRQYKRLNRRAQKYGVSVRKIRGRGFCFVINRTAALWSPVYGADELTLEEIATIVKNPNEEGAITFDALN